MIVILASEGVSNQDVSGKLRIHYNTVALWRTRFIDALPLLQEIEKVSPEKKWIFVCDGLNTHKSESLVKLISEACGLKEELERV